MEKLNLTNDNVTLRTQLLQEIAVLDPQQALFPLVNESINEIVQQLENINPISQPLKPEYLPYLVGKWQLIYASRGTVVTRRLALMPNWGEAITIDRVWQELATEEHNSMTAINAAIIELPLLGKWQLQANGIWVWDTPEQLAKVSFSSFSIQAKQLFGWSYGNCTKLTIPVLEWLRSEAVWVTSYLDPEIRVGRGATGNLFVFRRQ